MRHLPSLNALRAFEAAARHMSFQRAAEELDVTPTAISHQIKKLETQLQLSLFIRRNPHPLQLTEAGEQLYPVLCDGFDRFATAISALQPNPAATTLTVTAINDFALKWLGPRLPNFRESHPTIDIHLQTTVQVIDLHARTVDIAIRYGRGPYPDLAVHKLFSDVYIPVCSPSLIAGESPLKTPQDLVNRRLLHCEWVNYAGPDQPTWQRWLALAGVTGINPNKGPKFTGESLAIQAAIGGQGIALCSSIHVADDLAKRLLVSPFDIALDGFSFYGVHLHNHLKESQIVSFLDWVRAMISNDLQ